MSLPGVNEVKVNNGLNGRIRRNRDVPTKEINVKLRMVKLQNKPA